MAYAEGTVVEFDKSIAEVITLLRRAGASQIAQFDDDAFYSIQFTMAARMMRFRLPLPALDDIPKLDGRSRTLTREQRADRLAQSRRQRGRALLLVIKAKLESIESEVETFEQAFLAHIVMADGQTVYQRIAAPIALEYKTGHVDPVAGLLSGPATGNV